MESVLVGDGQTNVDGRKHRENVGLNHGNKDVQPHKRNGNENRENADDQAEDGALGPGPFKRAEQQSQENAVNQVAGKDVCPKTDGERKKAGRSGYDFHGKQQEGEEPISEMFRRPAKVRR